MKYRHASINEHPITADARAFKWPLGPRPEGHWGLNHFGF